MEMKVKSFYFTSLLFTALSMAPGMAHLLELPGKIHMEGDQYFIVQQISRGWALLGIITFLAMISNLILAIMTRKNRLLFLLNGTVFLCIAVSLIIFFSFTFPANQQTSNWTRVPSNWEKLRLQWEYSHAINACLYLVAFIALLISVLKRRRYVTKPR
jgi:hypothetical protein